MKTFSAMREQIVTGTLRGATAYSGLVTAFEMPDGTSFIIAAADMATLEKAATALSSGRPANLLRKHCRNGSVALTEKLVLRRIEPDDEEL